MYLWWSLLLWVYNYTSVAGRFEIANPFAISPPYRSLSDAMLIGSLWSATVGDWRHHD